MAGDSCSGSWPGRISVGDKADNTCTRMRGCCCFGSVRSIRQHNSAAKLAHCKGRVTRAWYHRLNSRGMASAQGVGFRSPLLFC